MKNYEETEGGGFTTRKQDLKPLERAGESWAIPIKECLYPKCEECDNYHGHYCTIPIVVSKQIYRLFEEKMRSMEEMIDWIEKAVTDEILGEEDGASRRLGRL